MSRADKLTPLAKTPEFFSDFQLSFAKHPVTRELARVTNAEAVKQSLKILLLSNFGEWPYRPLRGGNITASLFELAGAFTSEIVNRNVRDCVEANEPRARILALETITADDRQSIDVRLTFSLVNDPTPISLKLIVKSPR